MRLKRNPDEFGYAADTSTGGVIGGGLKHDLWSAQTTREKHRRLRWLQRYGRSPFQLLGISEDLLIRLGIEVVDWGPPPVGPRDEGLSG